MSTRRCESWAQSCRLRVGHTVRLVALTSGRLLILQPSLPAERAGGGIATPGIRNPGADGALFDNGCVLAHGIGSASSQGLGDDLTDRHFAVSALSPGAADCSSLSKGHEPWRERLCSVLH